MSEPDPVGVAPKQAQTLWLARILVGLQFGLAAWMFLSTPWLVWPSPAKLTGACALLAIGGAIAMWAWGVMGWRKLRVMPHPAQQAQLLRHGPYRTIRHPMYSGLLIACAGCLLWQATWLRAAAWFGLLVVLVGKTLIEEKLLQAKFPDYTHYAAQTWRFLPGIW